MQLWAAYRFLWAYLRSLLGARWSHEVKQSLTGLVRPKWIRTMSGQTLLLTQSQCRIATRRWRGRLATEMRGWRDCRKPQLLGHSDSEVPTETMQVENARLLRQSIFGLLRVDRLRVPEGNGARGNVKTSIAVILLQRYHCSRVLANADRE